MKNFFLFLAVLLIPHHFTYAKIYINEIAWMGTNVSANHEWIELINDGAETVSLEGWILEAQDGQPKINLEGTVAGGSFFLLERTSEESVPNITANQIYTGSLSNAGEILILKDFSGSVVDKIDGSDNWSNIGGNNETKETAQRTEFLSWITASPTPKAKNVSVGISLTESNDNSPSNSDENKISAPVSQIIPKETTLPRIYAEAGGDRTAISGADVVFSGVAYGYKKEILEKADYLWNFGDGSFSKGEKVLHAYVYPGVYIVSLSVSSLKDSATDYFTMTIIPNELVISSVGADYIAIKNGSPIRLDISNWVLESSGKRFVFPQGTMIKEKTEIFVPASISGLNSKEEESVFFLYPNGRIAHTFKNSSLAEVQTKSLPKTSVIAQTQKTSSANPIAQKIITTSFVQDSFPEPGIIEEVEKENDNFKEKPTENNNIASVGFSDFSFNWIFVILGLGILGGGGAIIARRFL